MSATDKTKTTCLLHQKAFSFNLRKTKEATFSVNSNNNYNWESFPTYWNEKEALSNRLERGLSYFKKCLFSKKENKKTLSYVIVFFFNLAFSAIL